MDEGKKDSEVSRVSTLTELVSSLFIPQRIAFVSRSVRLLLNRSLWHVSVFHYGPGWIHVWAVVARHISTLSADSRLCTAIDRASGSAHLADVSPSRHLSFSRRAHLYDTGRTHLVHGFDRNQCRLWQLDTDR